ncbi:ATP-binding protein [Sphingomonas naphthae]|uniref:histidine kinase n=1 Tax=Sphingomonas naphthae TaxID=1813468 RepID=A0ABY7TMC3_9SPHN|nr:ATP-binding protein [Sphingomonas naphthae]WCT74387.1 ATP-binding protein [Sphingomonas naphthae]
MTATRARLGGLSIFTRSLLVLLAGLVIAQMVAFGLIYSFGAPRPDFTRMSEIADTLGDRPHDPLPRPLIVTRAAVPPVRNGALTADPAFTAMLARRLEVPTTRVRLFFEPEQHSAFSPFAGRRRDEKPRRKREPIFFDRVVAAIEQDGRWTIAETPPPPMLAPWQKRLILWLSLSALAMVPLAWWFARAITKPMLSFAEAADRIGADPSAPSVPESGPAELRSTAQALNRMQGRLADYVAERTAMIGAIAHDLRTPLARIAFRIETAPDPMREKVQSDIEQMRAMIAATIGFVKSTARSDERKPVDLRLLLGRLVAQEQEVGRPVTMHGEGPLMISGDALALARLFQNLIDNGIAYGGAVAISAAHEAGGVAVLVQDDGPGMAPDFIARAFVPFERGDPSRSRETGGLGLGLSIARTIAEDHGGTIALANRSVGGLEVRCVFPAA